MKKILIICMLLIGACTSTAPKKNNKATNKSPFFWDGANIYFLLTDRFFNGDPTNDLNFKREKDGAVLRSFEGGDLAGVTQKLNDGYFNQLGISAIWMNPVIEQIHGYTDEGTGKTYPFHGYWARDWTSIDPNFGSFNEYSEFVNTAHKKGIRVIMDVVINHTGPVTPIDSQWPDDWVRTDPACTYVDFETTVDCTLVKNLPDILTNTANEVKLPPFLIEKWKNEGRYEEEIKELAEFFKRTGYPRTPRYYIIKWLVDYIRLLGIDGFRVDTVKHTEPDVWADLRKEADYAFQLWKSNHPEKVLDDNEFYMVGEVYNYSIYDGKDFAIGPNQNINFYDNGFNSLINFSLRSQQELSLDEISTEYSEILNKGNLQGYSVMNYISSHDDGSPYDKERSMNYEAANKLLLSPGASQIYYGDETARSLTIPGTEGDATLRSNMNWGDLQNKKETKELWDYYAKLGNFRKENPAVGAGIHTKLNDRPYTFKREFKKGQYSNKVIVSIENNNGEVNVANTFKNGDNLKNYFTGEIATVQNGKVKFNQMDKIILIGKAVN